MFETCILVSGVWPWFPLTNTIWNQALSLSIGLYRNLKTKSNCHYPWNANIQKWSLEDDDVLLKWRQFVHFRRGLKLFATSTTLSGGAWRMTWTKVCWWTWEARILKISEDPGGFHGEKFLNNLGKLWFRNYTKLPRYKEVLLCFLLSMEDECHQLFHICNYTVTYFNLYLCICTYHHIKIHIKFKIHINTTHVYVCDWIRSLGYDAPNSAGMVSLQTSII